MFYEIGNTIINLDKIYYIRKIINEKNDYILEISLNDKNYSALFYFSNYEKLELEYKKIKARLKYIYD